MNESPWNRPTTIPEVPFRVGCATGKSRCVKKRQHTKEQAIEVARTLGHFPYLCDRCGAWHTSKEKGGGNG